MKSLRTAASVKTNNDIQKCTLDEIVGCPVGHNKKNIIIKAIDGKFYELENYISLKTIDSSKMLFLWQKK